MNERLFRELRIFVACPGDVANERDKVHEAARELEPTADEYGFKLKVLDWREAVPDAGRGQAVIFKELKPESWDVFIGILWCRFGTPPGGLNPSTGEDFISGTHEEFQVAYELWRENSGRPRIMMYQCKRQLPFDHDAEQLKKVKDFIKVIQNPIGTSRVLSQSFETTDQFSRKILHDLQEVFRQYKNQISSNSVDTNETENTSTTAQAQPTPSLPQRADFFGREKELETVRKAISGESKDWGILIDAIGGMGKTALAVEAAHTAMDAGLFKACVYVTARLHRLGDTGIVDEDADALAADDFVNETARKLGRQDIAQMERKEKRKALFAALQETPTLLIYDNLETLEPEQQYAIARFLAGLPTGSKAILTSRRQGAEGCIHLHLRDIDWAAAEKIIEKERDKDENLAIRLGSNKEKWQELHKETFGSPLALMHILGLMRMRATLDIDRAIALLQKKEGIQERINFMFEEARKELNNNDKGTLYALSFFAPSADMTALCAVAMLEEVPVTDCIDRLDRLCLLETLPNARFALHPLTREFAQRELQNNANAAHDTGMRYAEYWLSYAEKNGGDSENYKTFPLIENEWQNIAAATNWLWITANVADDTIGNKDAGEMLNRFANALGQFLWYAGRWDERILISERGYRAMKAVKDEYNAGWRAYDAAFTWWNRGNTQEAEGWTELAVAAWKQGDSKYEKAVGLRMLGLIEAQKEAYTEAREYYEQALAIWREMEDGENIATVLNSLAGIAWKQQEYDAVEKYLAQVIEKTPDLGSKAGYTYNLGNLELGRKNYTAARKRYDEALHMAMEVGRQDIIAGSNFGLARVEEEAGRLEAALPHAEKALKIYEQSRDSDLQKTRDLVEWLRKMIADGKGG